MRPSPFDWSGSWKRLPNAKRPVTGSHAQGTSSMGRFYARKTVNTLMDAGVHERCETGL